jgi:hypothetical protein
MLKRCNAMPMSNLPRYRQRLMKWGANRSLRRRCYLAKASSCSASSSFEEHRQQTMPLRLPQSLRPFLANRPCRRQQTPSLAHLNMERIFFYWLLQNRPQKFVMYRKYPKNILEKLKYLFTFPTEWNIIFLLYGNNLLVFFHGESA